MSLKTFLTSIWMQIRILFNKMPQEIKIAIHMGVEITEKLKTFVDSPDVDILTTLIPGNIDDNIKLALRIALPKILSGLKLVDESQNLADPAIATNSAVKNLQQMNGIYQNAFFHNLSILLAQTISDGKLTWSDGATLLEWYYQNKFKQQ